MTSTDNIRYEPADAPPRLIGGLGAGIAGFLLLVPLALSLLYPAARHERVLTDHVSEIPDPRLQIDPDTDLAATRTREDAQLATYGWVERQRGTVHIPIERALELTAERGLPGWTQKKH